MSVSVTTSGAGPTAASRAVQFVAGVTICSRKESPTQTSAVARLQVSSGEIWGRAHRQNGLFEVVQAYPRPLHPGDRGIDFTTSLAPDPIYSAPHEYRWYYPQTPGVFRRTNANNDDFAAIPAVVVNKQP